MGVASEQAVSIPQITYDHIDDTEEKKDVTFFQDGKQESVEGNVITQLCSEHADVMTAVISSCYIPQTSLHAFLLKAQSACQYMKSLSSVSSSADLILHLINRHFIVNLTPQNAMYFKECAFSYTSRSLGIQACVMQRTFCTCDETNDDCWETSARLFPLIRFDLMKWCILNIVKWCHVLERPWNSHYFSRWLMGFCIQNIKTVKHGSGLQGEGYKFSVNIWCYLIGIYG